MNKGRWASIRLVARRSVCSAVDVSVILVSLRRSAITRLNLRRRPKQVYWSREQFGKIGRHALSREDLGQRQPKSDWYSWAWDTWAGESTSRIWLFDQLKFRGRCETIPAVFQNSRDDLQRPLSNVDGE